MLTLEILAGTVVPVLAILFVCAIGLVNLFLSVRKRFPVSVNCWFCNTDSKVPYDNGNSWLCPSCTQYNGFTEDGDYNREIPAQYQCRLNPRSNITDDDKISYSAPHNGLCFGCNRNQELKIHQLASFVPEIEDNYDEEVEEYQRQLEQTYKLCSRCERILKRTLNDVKRNILGSKLAQIGTKGLKVFDLHMQANEKQSAFQKRKTIADVCLWTIIALLVMKLGQRFTQCELSKDRLEIIFSPTVSQTILIFVSYLVALKYTFMAQWNGFLEKPLIVDSVNQLKTVTQRTIDRWSPTLDISEKISEVLNDTPEVMVQENALSNLAMICLAGMLMGVKSHVRDAKPIILITCCAAEMVFKTSYGLELVGNKSSVPLVELFLTTTALLSAIGCIGQTSPKIQSTDDLNSSFHKIYSQQANECDYSDTFEDNSSLLQDASVGSQKEYGQRQTSVNSMSIKSMDTTKSISPSVLTASTMRPFLDNSFSSIVSSPKSTFGASALSVNRLNTTFQEQPTRSFSRQSLIAAETSLLKTPSFSFDNFTTAIPRSTNHVLPKYGSSMNSINNSTLMEDDHFGDDIDRLSISGRMSISRKDVSMVNNPFATHHVDHDDSFSLRQRMVNISPPRLGAVAESGGSWIAGGYWGTSPQKNPAGDAAPASIGFGHPFMSRTSSQSSGFESQLTRRPTPEELGEVDLDRVSLFSEPVGMHPSTINRLSAFQQHRPRFNQTFSYPLPQSSPIPSHSSFFNRPAPQASSSRNLFGERSLFQPNAPLVASQSPSLTSAIAASGSHQNCFNVRSINVFPPQQSQTAMFSGSSNLFQPNAASLQLGGPKKMASSRRSLLNLSKLNETVEESTSGKITEE